MKFQIMDQTGHSTEVFDAATPEQLAAAQKRFEELVNEHKMTPAKRTGPGEAKLIRKFDPTAEAIVFQPQLVGG
jgi:hypothetical protein